MGSHFGSSSHAISGIDFGWLGNEGDVGAVGPRGTKSLAGTRKGAKGALRSFSGALALGLRKGQQLDSLEAERRRCGRGGSGYVPFSSGCLAGDQCAKDR
jgi:hypothetical protein